jgi:hypothetical protein
MKYIIKEVLPAQILVEFEDESRALVPISPEATPEEIDHAVAQYDPDFLPIPENLINQNISVGEERESKKLDTVNTQFAVGNNTTTDTNTIEEFIPTQFNSIEYLLNSINPINLALANYYAEQGDTRIKEALYSKVLEYVNVTNLTVEKILEDINLNPEDILSQAELELNGEITPTPEDTSIQTPEEVIATPEEVIATPEEVIATPEEVIATPEEVIATPEEVIATPEDTSIQTPEEVTPQVQEETNAEQP